MSGAIVFLKGRGAPCTYPERERVSSMRARGAARSLLVLGFCLALTGCSGGGGSDPQQGVYRGHIRDAEGNPVASARVSIDGIEAGALTDSSGYYEVSDGGLSTESLALHNAARVEGAGVDVEISVLAEGFAVLIAAINVKAGAFADVSLGRAGIEPTLTISGPRSGETFVLDSACGAPSLTVEGFAGIRALESLRSDIVLVLFNTRSAGSPGCSGQSIAAGSARTSFTVPSGARVAFFLVPDRTLADFQSRPATGNHPLFTLSRLNPGNFDQSLTFRTGNGRTRPGPSVAVETSARA
jgi:hypothetical protein